MQHLQQQWSEVTRLMCNWHVPGKRISEPYCSWTDLHLRMSAEVMSQRPKCSFLTNLSYECSLDMRMAKLQMRAAYHHVAMVH